MNPNAGSFAPRAAWAMLVKLVSENDRQLWGLADGHLECRRRKRHEQIGLGSKRGINCL
jgi:hypothetical protein